MLPAHGTLFANTQFLFCLSDFFLSIRLVPSSQRQDSISPIFEKWSEIKTPSPHFFSISRSDSLCLSSMRHLATAAYSHSPSWPLHFPETVLSRYEMCPNCPGPRLWLPPSLLSNSHRKVPALRCVSGPPAHGTIFHLSSHTVPSSSALLMPLTSLSLNDGISQLLSCVPSSKYFLLLGVSICPKTLNTNYISSWHFSWTRFYF